jgi:hypothetical protein
MNDLGEAYYVLGIQILHDSTSSVLGFCHKIYIGSVLSIFNMWSCSHRKDTYCER